MVNCLEMSNKTPGNLTAAGETITMKNTIYFRSLAEWMPGDSNPLNQVCLQQALHPCGGLSAAKLKSTQKYIAKNQSLTA